MTEQLLKFQFYFTPRPDPNFEYTRLTLSIVVALILAGVLFGLYRKKYLKNPIWKKILRRYPRLLQNYGIALLILLLFRETGMPYLSMRIGWVLWLLFFAYSLFKFFFTFKRQYAERAERLWEVSKRYRYLPKKKQK